MNTFSENQQKIVNTLEAVNCARWIDNHNGTIDGEKMDEKGEEWK